MLINNQLLLGRLISSVCAETAGRQKSEITVVVQDQIISHLFHRLFTGVEELFHVNSMLKIQQYLSQAVEIGESQQPSCRT